jgi:hypothetical protein
MLLQTVQKFIETQIGKRGSHGKADLVSIAQTSSEKKRGNVLTLRFAVFFQILASVVVTQLVIS